METFGLEGPLADEEELINVPFPDEIGGEEGEAIGHALEGDLEVER
jgi:hypothetical protein